MKGPFRFFYLIKSNIDEVNANIGERILRPKYHDYDIYSNERERDELIKLINLTASKLNHDNN